MSSAPRIDLAEHLGQLVSLAEQLHIELSNGNDFETTLELRTRYNDAFGQFQLAVTGGAALGAAHVTQLARLEQLHSANMANVAQRKNEARSELGSTRRFQRISGYAPLGATHVPDARFVDDAA